MIVGTPNERGCVCVRVAFNMFVHFVFAACAIVLDVDPNPQEPSFGQTFPGMFSNRNSLPNPRAPLSRSTSHTLDPLDIRTPSRFKPKEVLKFSSAD